MTHSSRISIYFVAMFGALGVHFIYFQIFLKDLGLNIGQIGAVYAVLPLVSMVAAPFWGAVADSQSDPRRVLKTLLFLGPLSYGVILIGNQFAVCVILALFLGVFYLPILPIQDSLALRSIHLYGGDYGKIRVWGSIGFVVPALVLPLFWGPHEMGKIDWFIPGLIFGAYAVAAWLLALGFPAVPPEKKHGFTFKGFQLFRDRNFLVLMVTVFLARWASTGLEGFQAIFFEEKGVGVQYLALFISIGPLSEIGVIYYSQRWVARYRAYPLMALCLAALVVRLLVTAASDNLTVLFLIQLTHCLTFGLQYMITILVVNQLADDSIRSSAQTIAVLIGTSFARVTGYAFSGLFAYRLGFSALFGASSVIAFAALVLWLLLYRDTRATTLDDGVR